MVSGTVGVEVEGRLTRDAKRLMPDAKGKSASPRTTALILRPLMRLLADRGLDVDAFLASHGLDRATLALPEARLEVATTRKLLEDAEALTGDPALGLSLVRYTEYTAFGPLGVALSAGGSLRGVLERMVRYHTLVSDAMSATLEADDDALVVRFHDREGCSPHPQSVLFILASIAAFVRLRLAHGSTPRRLVLRDVDERCRAAAERVFHCPVALGEGFALEYPSDAASALLDGSDPEMAALLEQSLTSRLGESERSLALELGLYLESRLPEGVPTLAEAAKALRQSERSLQRRLEEQGLSYQKVLDDTRRTLAERHLHTPGMSLTQLAFLLGFSDVSSFSRAFRKWYGVPASQYKKPRAPRSER